MAKEVNIFVTGVRKNEPDLRKLARALIQLVMAEQEAESVKDENEQISEQKREAS